MRRPSPWLLAVAASALLVGGCTDEPADDPDRIVLRPPAEGADHTHAPGESDPAPIGDGTRADAGGYRLVGLSLPRPTDGPADLRFRILGPDGLPVTDYTQQQTKLMHLYVVRNDYAVYRHLHPTLADDGTWTVPVDLSASGGYRVIADFLPTAAERPVVLGRRPPAPRSGSRPGAHRERGRRRRGPGAGRRHRRRRT